MALLHTVNKSPFDRNALSDCLRRVKPGSAILLMEDGVYGALDETSVSDQIIKKNSEVKFYVLAPDLAARGLSEKPLIEGLNLIDYDGFVNLVEECSSIQSWL